MAQQLVAAAVARARRDGTLTGSVSVPIPASWGENAAHHMRHGDAPLKTALRPRGVTLELVGVSRTNQAILCRFDVDPKHIGDVGREILNAQAVVQADFIGKVADRVRGLRAAPRLDSTVDRMTVALPDHGVAVAEVLTQWQTALRDTAPALREKLPGVKLDFVHAAAVNDTVHGSLQYRGR